MTTTDVAAVDSADFELDQRRAKAYAESGYWPDAQKVAQALVKIEAGRSLGLPPIVAMSEVHVIKGRPQVGAGALSMLVKASGKYDYDVVEITNERCVIRVVATRSGVVLGESVFTMADAKQAGLDQEATYKKYPRNMLFARAMSNAVAWYCPDVTSGRVYTDGELDTAQVPHDTEGYGITVDEVDWPDDQADLYDAEQDMAADLGEEGDPPDDYDEPA